VPPLIPDDPFIAEDRTFVSKVALPISYQFGNNFCPLRRRGDLAKCHEVLTASLVNLIGLVGGVDPCEGHTVDKINSLRLKIEESLSEIHVILEEWREHQAFETVVKSLECCLQDHHDSIHLLTRRSKIADFSQLEEIPRDINFFVER
jgi:hypothetical protein